MSHHGVTNPLTTNCVTHTARPRVNDTCYDYPVTGSVEVCQTQGVTYIVTKCSKVFTITVDTTIECAFMTGIYVPHSESGRPIPSILDDIHDMTLVIPLPLIRRT